MESGCNDDSVDTVDPSKIAYVARACVFCKRRHLKCDGCRPCVQCRLRTQDCIYESTKKRGRKPAEASAPAPGSKPTPLPASSRRATTPTAKQPKKSGKQQAALAPAIQLPLPSKIAKSLPLNSRSVSSSSSPNSTPLSIPKAKRMKTDIPPNPPSLQESSVSSDFSSVGLSRDQLLQMLECQQVAITELQYRLSMLDGRIGREESYLSDDVDYGGIPSSDGDSQESSNSGSSGSGASKGTSGGGNLKPGADARVRRKVPIFSVDSSISSAMLIKVFVARNGFLFPAGRPPIDPSAASDYLNTFKSTSQFARLLQSDSNTLSEAFSYGVAFALGGKALARWHLVKDMIYEINNKILHRILQKDILTAPQNSLCVARVISGVCFHVMIHVSLGQFAEARQSALTAFNSMNQTYQQLVPSLQYTVYTHMASLCRRPQSKLHFLDCAEKLGQEASPPINQVFLAVFVAGEILSANEALFDLTYHQEKSGASHDYDYRLKLHQYTVNALDSIDNSPSFSNGRNISMASTLKMMASGCRAIAAFHIGKTEEALAWASAAIQVVKYIDTSILPLLIAFALAYATQTCLLLQQKILFFTSMERFKPFTTMYPVAVRIWNKLHQQALSMGFESPAVQQMAEYTPANYLSSFQSGSPPRSTPSDSPNPATPVFDTMAGRYSSSFVTPPTPSMLAVQFGSAAFGATPTPDFMQMSPQQHQHQLYLQQQQQQQQQLFLQQQQQQQHQHQYQYQHQIVLTEQLQLEQRQLKDQQVEEQQQLRTKQQETDVDAQRPRQRPRQPQLPTPASPQQQLLPQMPPYYAATGGSPVFRFPSPQPANASPY